jgi:hypothetical protein
LCLSEDKKKKSKSNGKWRKMNAKIQKEGKIETKKMIKK